MSPKKISRCLPAFLLVLILLINFSGCLSFMGKVPEEEPVEGEKIEFYRPQEEELSENILDWVDRSLNMQMGQQMLHEDKLYILVTYGEKPTGGYQVTIKEALAREDCLLIEVEFKAPQEGDLVPQVITYPYDLVVLEKDPSLPVKFQVTGDEDCLMTLKGIEKLEPVAVESPSIKVFQPAPNEEVGRNFEIRGIANLSHKKLGYEITQDKGDYSYQDSLIIDEGDWCYYCIPVEIPPELKGNIQVELYSKSPQDGNKTGRVSYSLNLKEE